MVGATGNLGTAVVRRLKEQGRPVRALTRRRERAARLEALGAEIVTGDLRDRSSLERACQDTDFVVASAHAALGRGANGPRSVDGTGHRQLVDTALASGSTHFVYVGAVGVSPTHPIDFFRIKYETEEYVRSSGIPHTIVRGAPFMETWLQILGRPILEKGRVTLFGRGTTRWNYVAVRDMAHYVVLALGEPRLRNRTIDVGGPENLTQIQFVETIERIVGRSARRTQLPVPLIRTMGALIRPVHPGIARMLGLGALLGSTEGPLDTGSLASEFPIEPTRLEDATRQWFDVARATPRTP